MCLAFPLSIYFDIQLNESITLEEGITEVLSDPVADQQRNNIEQKESYYKSKNLIWASGISE